MDEEELKLIEELKEEKDPIKKANLLRILNSEKQIRIKTLATLLKITPSYICHLLRILRLPDIVTDGYYAKNLNVTHLFLLSRLKDPQDIIDFYEKILTGNLNVSEVEELVREKLYDVNSMGAGVEDKIKEKIAAKFKKIDPDAKVKIVQTRIKTRVEISYKGSRQKTTDFLKKMSSDY